MYYGDVFSWAEDKNGKMVYVDDVPGGASCNCTCPCCHEKLIARHGNERMHGFAHASKERGANLNICLKVITFKLAEQIIATEKKIRIPSYHGIYKAQTIEFESVEINSCFERKDRQPDIIATTKEKQKYLIEFSFNDYVRHKQKVDYKNLNCLEIDLNGQKISDKNSLKDFLINSDDNRNWLNNDTYFNSIENLYQSKGKSVRLIAEESCQKCPIKNTCCAVRQKGQNYPLLIKHNEQYYQLCKTEKYTQYMKEYERQKEEDKRNREENLKRDKEIIQNRRKETTNNITDSETNENKKVNQQENSQYDNNIDISERSCFNCKNNLKWANKGGWANCGCYSRLGIHPRNRPEQAINCQSFARTD